MDLFRSKVFFSAKNYLQSSHYKKNNSATIAFFSSPPFFLPALSFSPFLSFVSVIFELITSKKPAVSTPFYSNGCKSRWVGFQKIG